MCGFVGVLGSVYVCRGYGCLLQCEYLCVGVIVDMTRSG